MRLTGDPDGRVSVFSRFERDCFLGGVRNGEFDDAASSTADGGTEIAGLPSPDWPARRWSRPTALSAVG